MKQLLIFASWLLLLSSCQVYKSMGRKAFEANSSGKIQGQSAIRQLCLPSSEKIDFEICIQTSADKNYEK